MFKVSIVIFKLLKVSKKLNWEVFNFGSWVVIFIVSMDRVVKMENKINN